MGEDAPSILAILHTDPSPITNTRIHVSIIGISIGVFIAVLIRWFYLSLVGAMLKRGVIRGKPVEGAPGFFMRASHGRMHYAIRTANGKVAAHVDPSESVCIYALDVSHFGH
jgi:hypothetical protein